MLVVLLYDFPQPRFWLTVQSKGPYKQVSTPINHKDDVKYDEGLYLLIPDVLLIANCQRHYEHISYENEHCHIVPHHIPVVVRRNDQLLLPVAAVVFALVLFLLLVHVLHHQCFQFFAAEVLFGVLELKDDLLLSSELGPALACFLDFDLLLTSAIDELL